MERGAWMLQKTILEERISVLEAERKAVILALNGPHEPEGDLVRAAMEAGDALQAIGNKVLTADWDFYHELPGLVLAVVKRAEQAEAERDAARDEVEKESERGWLRGVAYMIGLVGSLGFHVNSDDLFTEPGVTLEDFKKAGVDSYDLQQIGRFYKSSLRKFRGKPRSAHAAENTPQDFNPIQCAGCRLYPLRCEVSREVYLASPDGWMPAPGVCLEGCPRKSGQADSESEVGQEMQDEAPVLDILTGCGGDDGQPGGEG